MVLGSEEITQPFLIKTFIQKSDPPDFSGESLFYSLKTRFRAVSLDNPLASCKMET